MPLGGNPLSGLPLDLCPFLKVRANDKNISGRIGLGIMSVTMVMTVFQLWPPTSFCSILSSSCGRIWPSLGPMKGDAA